MSGQSSEWKEGSQEVSLVTAKGPTGFLIIPFLCFQSCQGNEKGACLRVQAPWWA